MAKKKEENTPHILKNSLEDILADRFSRYSKYIIQNRALPDARDGLKPVQRRILYAMYEAGNTYNKPYHKSAKTVGNVIGNYHPHGDTSVYDAMVRMSQNWKMANPLVDMQGNNGSIDDDPAAAMRYTEARLSKIANYLLMDIEKDTVEWAPNFSDEKMEPTVLPARFPNLLVNGITGIAAGYATNIPPHNLNEVIQACIYRIQNPDCTLQELMNFVKGPDFPTGGIVMGKQGIIQALQTGRGKVIIRSKVKMEETKTIKKIVVYEIPYEVIKTNVVKKIDDIRLNKKIDGILDVRDESDRNGLRIVIDIKKEARDDQILNYLYKNTDLQVSYNYNMIAIDNKAPVQMGLEQAIDSFIQHRQDVILRRSQHDLDAKLSRYHILEGLIKAVSVMDEIVKIIRSSKDKNDAKKNLIARFVFSEAQAEAIVTMRLYRLTNTDVVLLEKESKQLQKEIKTLKQILNSKEKLASVIIKELQEVNTEFVTPRLSEIQEDIEEIVIDEKAMIADEQVMLPITYDGYVKKVSMRSYKSSNELLCNHKDQDHLIASGPASTLQTLLFFTNKGNYGYLPVYQIEEAKWKDLGSHLSSYVKMENQEKVIAAYLLHEFDCQAQVICISRYGMIKRTSLKELESTRHNKTISLMKVGSMDEMIAARISLNLNDSVCLLTQNGFALQYEVNQIPLQMTKSKGVKAMNLQQDDCVVDCQVGNFNQSHFLFVTSQCQMKRMKSKDIATLKRPAKGNRICKAVKSNPSLLRSFFSVDLKDELVLVEEENHIFMAKDIPLMNEQATFSNPFGKIDQFEWIQPLKTIEKGQWKEMDTEEVQLSLFDMES
ncbi:DNA topoisomerase IV subunit A [Floccifex sp.]|uniref:DNA topoisomerase IV subunit A n=1 Tax=Floccifex sp. TaxID=2815810 RepID=UPI003F0BD462